MFRACGHQMPDVFDNILVYTKIRATQIVLILSRDFTLTAHHRVVCGRGLRHRSVKYARRAGSRVCPPRVSQSTPATPAAATAVSDHPESL
ncbi:unnamed protein product, partial [Brenthis ino]